MRFPDARILIFAKAPVSGFAKTRLIPELGASGAAIISREMLERTVTLVCNASLCQVELWCAPDRGDRVFTELAASYPLQLKDQQVGDIGQRMSAGFDCALQRSSYVLLIGTDAPAADEKLLELALQSLDDGQDVVLGPVEDGGYWLIGMRGRFSLFDGIAWGGREVAESTRKRLGELGLNWTELPVIWDLDDHQNLSRYRKMFGNRTGQAAG